MTGVKKLPVNFDALTGATTSNDQQLTRGDILRGVTVAVVTSAITAIPAEIYLVNLAIQPVLSLLLDHGIIWSSDLGGQLRWDGSHGPVDQQVFVRTAVRNDTGATVTIYSTMEVER